MYMGLALPLERIHDIPVSKRAPLTLGELDERRFYRQELISLWKITPGLKIIRAYLINLASLFYPFLPSYDWTYILFVPLWMWALFHTKENSSLSPLWLMVGLYVFIHIFAGGPVSRYRQVLAIPLIIAATAGAMDLSARSGKRFWYLFWGWASINILVFMIAPVARDFVLTLAHLLHTHS